MKNKKQYFLVNDFLKNKSDCELEGKIMEVIEVIGECVKVKHVNDRRKFFYKSYYLHIGSEGNIIN